MSNKKIKVTIEIVFEDEKDFKLHMGMIRERVNTLLRNPDAELSSEYDSGWSSHKFSIDQIDK